MNRRQYRLSAVSRIARGAYCGMCNRLYSPTSSCPSIRAVKPVARGASRFLAKPACPEPTCLAEHKRLAAGGAAKPRLQRVASPTKKRMSSVCVADVDVAARCAGVE